VAHDLLEAARRIGAGVAGPAAEAVDRDARFPHEAIAALREQRLLGAFVPEELGGRGATIAELAAVCETLGRFCASTAMIYAMHQIEVTCLVRHGLSTPFFRSYLAELAEREWLIASATSEVGVGGDLRRSVCALILAADRFAHAVAVEAEGFVPDDNYLHLEPGEPRRLVLRAEVPYRPLRGSVSALNGEGAVPIACAAASGGD
jgi:hypothetical protein